MLEQIGRDDKVSNETKEKIMMELITREKINPEVFNEIRRFKFSWKFGWTPSQIDNEKVEDLLVYESIMAGLNSPSPNEMKKMI